MIGDSENSTALKGASENLAAEKKAHVEKAAARMRFPVGLRAVWNRLGLSKEGERALRAAHLKKGVDWEEVSNGVWYSEAGLTALAGLIADGAQKMGGGSRVVEPQEAMASVGQGDAPLKRPGAIGEEKLALSGRGNRRIAGLLLERTGEAVSPPFLVRTLRCHFPNVRVVEVQVDVTESSYGPAVYGAGLVRGYMTVRSSENFLPGMLCWARVERGVGTWTFMGRGDQPATGSPVGPRSRGRW